jgi:hypothetical protein
MDRPEQWRPAAAPLSIYMWVWRQTWFVYPFFAAAVLGAILRAALRGPAFAVAVVGATAALAFAIHLLWRTGRGRRRGDAVALSLGWLAFLVAVLLGAAAPADQAP